MNKFWIFAPLLWANATFGQFSPFNARFETLNGQALRYPLAGGMANPQFGSVDIDGDGREDIAVFDRVGNVWNCFRNNGNGGFNGWDYVPSWSSRFPKVEQWALLRDYNGDGLADIFCNGRNPVMGQIGIFVYKAERGASGLIRYNLQENILFYKDPRNGSATHIFVSNVDIPDVSDMDYDGDLDILTFNSLGGYVELYRNISVDSGWVADSLRYVLADDCWGRFYESGLSEQLDLSPRPDSCARYVGWSPLRTPNPPQPRHAGSALTTIDINADRRRELLLSDISFNNIALVANNGSLTEAWAQTEETFFPRNNVAVSLSQFPAAYLIDANDDQATDLIASPSVDEVSENVNCVWLYENIGTDSFPVFDLVRNDFLVGEMVEVGNTAAPTWVDYDGDGLTDLVIGTAGFFVNTTTVSTKLLAYKNVGTATAPVFALRDTDFARLSPYGLARIVPRFYDLDADGDLDMIAGNEDGTLFTCRNNGNANLPNFAPPVLNYSGIDVGSHSVPALYDLDTDGDLDMVVGERNGNLNLFINNGSASIANFSATPTSLSWGNVDARVLGSNEGNSAPILKNINGSLQLWTGAEWGGFYLHDSIAGNLLGSFRNRSAEIQNLDEGRHSIGDLHDIDGDGFLELVVGNKRGGIGIYTYNPNLVALSETAQQMELLAYPNPAKDRFWLQTPQQWQPSEQCRLEIYDPLGRLLLQLSDPNQIKNPIDISAMPTGLLLVKISDGRQAATIKLIKL